MKTRQNNESIKEHKYRHEITMEMHATILMIFHLISFSVFCPFLKSF